MVWAPIILMKIVKTLVPATARRSYFKMRTGFWPPNVHRAKDLLRRHTGNQQKVELGLQQGTHDGFSAQDITMQQP